MWKEEEIKESKISSRLLDKLVDVITTWRKNGRQVFAREMRPFETC